MAGFKTFIFVVLYISASTFKYVKSQDVPPYTEDCQHGMYAKQERCTGQPPKFTVNLDLAPEVRWKEVMEHKGNDMKAMVNQIKLLIGAFSPKIIEAVDKYLPEIIEKLPAPYDGEIQGISNVSGMKLAEVLLFNIFYEIFTMCTSIVAEDVTGNLYHARNLDFGLFMGWDTKNHTWLIAEYLRPLVINVDFVRGGKLAYKSVHFAGYVGILSGMKPGVFSFTLNERFNIDGGYIGMMEWIVGDRNGSWTSFLPRDVLEKANSYKEAVSMLSEKEILAPVYYIVGGAKSGEGSIITRDRTKTANFLPMSSTEEKWYVLETNYDNWENAPFFDDRRTPGKKCMGKTGSQNINFSTLYDVLSTKPNLNQLTTYTTLMQVNKGLMETYIRDCPNPCWPW